MREKVAAQGVLLENDGVAATETGEGRLAGALSKLGPKGMYLALCLGLLFPY